MPACYLVPGWRAMVPFASRGCVRGCRSAPCRGSRGRSAAYLHWY